MRVFSRLPLLLALGSLCPPSDGYSTESTTAWETKSSQALGACDFRLEQAYLRHDVEWQAGAEMTVTNVGEASARCVWEISIIGSAGDVISQRAGHAENLDAGATTTRFVEVAGSFAADALQHGAWLHVRLHEGWLADVEGEFDVVNPARDATF